MKNINFALLLALISLCYGCKDKEKYLTELLELSNPPAGLTFDNQFTLLPSADTLNLKLPQWIPNYVGMVDWVANDSTYYFKYASNKIAIANLSKSTLDSLILPEESITGIIKSINVLNKDSIILIQNNPHSLILLKRGQESEFHLLPKINFTCQNNAFNQLSKNLAEDEGNYILDYTHTYYDATNQEIHIGIQPLMAYNQKGFEESERIAIFNLVSKKWSDIYAEPKGILKYKENKTFTYLLSQKRIHTKNDTLFVSYFNDHYIYYYKDGKYLGKFPHISQHSKSIFLPVSSSYLDDAENKKKIYLCCS